MNKLVILTGKARAGKDTSLIHLQYLLHLKYNRIVQSLHFAAPLKKFCMEVLGLSYNHCYGDTHEKNAETNILWDNVPIPNEVKEKYRRENNSTGKYLTGREVMEIFGSYICRQMFSECWAKAAEIEYAKNMSVSNLQYFITDCRFPNEIEVFKKYDPLIIRLSRNTENRQAVSETSLDNFDWSSYNTIHIDNQNMTLDERNKVLEELVLPRL